ncbi:MAG: sialidase family protein [Legionella sp.]|nr:sialidase family protein [Legionella sp.]
MKKYDHKKQGLIIAGMLVTSLAQASIPVWNFSVPSPAVVTVADGSTSTVHYTVTNQSNKAKNLVLQYTPGLNASSCHLVGKGSTCNLAITIHGSSVSKEGIKKGPVLCQANSDGSPNLNQCYQPEVTKQLQVNKTEVSSFIATVGEYFDGTRFVPLSYYSLDRGLSWILSHPLPSVQGSGENYINSIACANSQCAAVGSYSNGTRAVPLSYYSTDNGQNWSLSRTLPMAQGTGENSLNGIACAGQQCAAVGSYNNGTRTFSLSYYSIDNGQNWILSSGLPTAQGSGTNYLNSTACEDNQCVAVGAYYNGTRYAPLSYYSTDHGQNWTLSPIQPSYQGTGNNYLNSITCSGNQCASVGTYYNGTRSVALSYYSLDHGLSWILSNTLPIAQGTGTNKLTGIMCTGNQCATVGSYYDGTRYVPVSYYSTDYGLNWTESFTQPSAQGTGDNALNSIMCTGNQCTAVGVYNKGTRKVPVSYYSTDYGLNWTLSPTLPPAQGFDNNLLVCLPRICR